MDFYNKTFNIYKLPFYNSKITVLHHSDISFWKNPVRVYETTIINKVRPNLVKYLQSENVDPSINYIEHDPNILENVKLYKNNEISNFKFHYKGLDETLLNIIDYINCEKCDEMLLTSHKTDIKYDIRCVQNILIPNMKKLIRNIKKKHENIIIWISTTSQSQVPIAETIKLSNNSSIYLIISNDIDMPKSLSNILPISRTYYNRYIRNNTAISMEFTFNKKSLKNNNENIYFENIESETCFSEKTDVNSSSFIKITKQFTPKFGREFIMCIPDISKLISITVNEISNLKKRTIYHLKDDKILIKRTPLSISSSELRVSDIYGIYIYYKYYLKNVIVDKHNIGKILNYINDVKLQKDYTDNIMRYEKVSDLIKNITFRDTKIYKLLNNKNKRFINKISLISELPIPPPPKLKRSTAVCFDYTT